MSGRTPENGSRLNPPLAAFEPATGDVWLVSSPGAAEAGKKASLLATQIPPGSDFDWLEELRGRDVVVALNCDDEGRKLTAALVERLPETTNSVCDLDLNSTATDGYNLSDYFGEASVDER